MTDCIDQSIRPFGGPRVHPYIWTLSKLRELISYPDGESPELEMSGHGDGLPNGRHRTWQAEHCISRKGCSMLTGNVPERYSRLSPRALIVLPIERTPLPEDGIVVALRDDQVRLVQNDEVDRMPGYVACCELGKVAGGHPGRGDHKDPRGIGARFTVGANTCLVLGALKVEDGNRDFGYGAIKGHGEREARALHICISLVMLLGLINVLSRLALYDLPIVPMPLRQGIERWVQVGQV
ncbi:hypothetical protein QBC46DRAFT_410478 [Diplogelasinospora grovesii]|uniref:Uncharacterized protein n=1 Tax=Diplogelasinospora grovesii TaxID=303347 RepID=A0AAN6S308_9PEZI|nr:hypothetical protein QBC46DRAFT_410478 [Diplogelasinospora grovesii]